MELKTEYKQMCTSGPDIFCIELIKFKIEPHYPKGNNQSKQYGCFFLSVFPLHVVAYSCAHSPLLFLVSSSLLFTVCCDFEKHPVLFWAHSTLPYNEMYVSYTFDCSIDTFRNILPFGIEQLGTVFKMQRQLTGCLKNKHWR